MPSYHTLGKLPRKRHIALRKVDGGLHHEQLIGNMGFTGPSSLLYHLRPPTAVRRVDPVEQLNQEWDSEIPVRHRHFRLSALPAGGSPTLGRKPIMGNGDISLFFCKPTENDEHFYRNAAADEYVFVFRGRGVLESQFGDLPFVAGDQLMIHRGILHRYRFDGSDGELFVAESRGYLRFPKRYRNEYGQILEGAPFSERDLGRPTELRTFDEEGEFQVVVKQAGGMNRLILAHHPCDVVGWDGCYYPWKFNIHDFEPITGMIHQPPPIHQLLEGDGFVICNFCPRPYDFHPEAIPAPYNHSNVMSDEVLFYASDNFMSRSGIEAGSLTLHPDGLPHGPHPGRYEASMGQERTDELAVMVDTFRSLQVHHEARAWEDPSYPLSWSGKATPAEKG